MKHRNKRQLLLALSAGLILPLGNTAAADEPTASADTANWECRLCPVSGGWFGDWAAGLIVVGDATPKFADYRGLASSGAYVHLDADGGYRGEDGRYLDFSGRDLGIDRRALSARAGKQGAFEVRVRYSEIPRYMGHGTVTPFLGAGSDTLVLSDPVKMAPAELSSKRKTTSAGLTFRMGSAWKFDAQLERQSRDGTRTFGGGLFATSGALFPAPIDYATTLFRSGLEFSGKRSQLRLEVLTSDFENHYDSVTWDNPMALGWGDEVSRSALEPDNEYRQVSLSGAFSFSPRFRVSGKASVGRAEQNAMFLPYSINPDHGDLELPRESLDGKIKTSAFNLSGRLYLRLARRLNVTAHYKVNERDNQTPVDLYTPILLEVFTSGPRSNRPYSYDRTQGRLELSYRPGRKLRLGAGAGRDRLERTYQDVKKTEEDSLWGEMQFSPWAWLDARLKLDRLDREARAFEEQGNYDRAENPLMRKFNMADRERDRATVELDLAPHERFDLALSYYTTEDEYGESLIGLTGGEQASLSLDLNYVLSRHTSVYAFITRDEIESDLSGADAEAATAWNARTRDEIETWGLGISGRLNDRWSIGLDYVSSKSDGNVVTDSGAGELPFPVLETDLRNTRLFVHYKASERWGLALDAYRESYRTSDWYVDGIGPTDITGILTMGEIAPRYDVNVVRLLATVNF